MQEVSKRGLRYATMSCLVQHVALHFALSLKRSVAANDGIRVNLSMRGVKLTKLMWLHASSI